MEQDNNKKKPQDKRKQLDLDEIKRRDALKKEQLKSQETLTKARERGGEQNK
jgi:hypothetical protein